jgi:amino acid adenylation domain-containing protein
VTLGQFHSFPPEILRVDQLIDRQAEHNPKHIAVRHKDKTLTYTELSSRSNQLAHALIERGIVPETLVGISTARTVEMVIAVLGIFKAGAAFVPLDPAYPKDRLTYMLEDSKTKIIITDRVSYERLPENDAEYVFIDELNLDAYPSTSPAVVNAPNDLAYCVFTSGSTGRPKGVMIEHASLLSFVAWTSSRFTGDQLSCVLCSSSLSFDVSYFEIFAPLSVGGSIYIVKNILDLLLEPPRAPIRTISTVASALAELVRMRAIPQTVNLILQAGEYLPATLARDLYRLSHIREVVNLCGATEDTVYSVDYKVPRNVPEDPPIGRAFLHRFAYILDEDMQPVPAGVPGEIYYGGSGVARGYINRPELTAARFLPNPFGHSPTMYRSGDIAYWGEDGQMRYMRRNDQQVKIRGYRVELADVEAVVREYPGLDQVAVLARDVGGHKSLVAYAVVREGVRVDYDDFARFAGQRLPEYMVPSSLVFVDFMPIGPSGKLDREALTRLETRRPEIEEQFLEARSDRERQLAALMAEILGIDRIGVNDNFFMLGGQSLLATRYIAKVCSTFPHETEWLDAEFGENAVLARFFREPTVAALETALASASEPTGAARASASPLQCIQEGQPGHVPFFLLHGVLDGEAFYSWNLAQGIGTEVPLYTIAPHGAHGAPVPETIQEMAAEYLALIRTIQPKGPYRLGGYCNGGYVALEIARTLRAEGETVDALLIIAATARNVRFKRLYATVERFGRLTGLSASKRRQLFVRLRGRLVALEQGPNPRKQPAAALRNILKRHSEAKHHDEARILARPHPVEVNYQRILKFLRAIDAYVPQPYAGSARVLWGVEDSYSVADDPYNGWEQVLKPLDYRHVTGGHVFLEDHPELVVEHLVDLVKAPAPGA